MTIRKDKHIDKVINIEEIRSKEELRKFMLGKYAVEDCGAHVRYFVEELADGKRIYLERPARLNKGCDFVIFAEDVITFNNGNDKAPSHKDVLKDLREKKRTLTPEQYGKVSAAIQKIYEVASFEDAYQFVSTLPEVGWSYELLLKLIRWLFIEQDITYWSGDGREMLKTAIDEV